MVQNPEPKPSEILRRMEQKLDRHLGKGKK